MRAIRASGGAAKLPDDVAARVARAEASSMVAFLQGLADGYGGAEGWACGAGIGDDTLTSLRAASSLPLDGNSRVGRLDVDLNSPALVTLHQ